MLGTLLLRLGCYSVTRIVITVITTVITIRAGRQSHRGECTSAHRRRHPANL